MEERAVDARRFADRMRRLRVSLCSLGADAILVSQLPNIRYLCGFSGSAGLLLVEMSGSTLFTDSRYTFQARNEVAAARIRIARRGLLSAVGDKLRSHRARRRVAYAPGALTVAQQQALRAATGKRLRWINDQALVEKLRSIKDDDELRLMKGAAQLISDVFCGVVKLVKPGIKELDVAAEIEYQIKRRGGSGPSFETIVASGPRSAWAHGQPSAKLLRKKDLVVLDQGAILRGYCSDMTRTVHLGRAAREVRGLYQAVLEAQAAAKSAVRPGVKAEDVDKAARDVLRRHGLGRFFTHSTGHGLGLEIHEMPRIGAGDKTVLHEGMVVTVEPGVYLEGLGGIRIEDEVLVTARGAVDLTTAPRDIFEL